MALPNRSTTASNADITLRSVRFAMNSEGLLDQRFQLGFGDVSDDLVDNLASLEEDHRGNPAYAVCPGSPRVFIDARSRPRGALLNLKAQL